MLLEEFEPVKAVIEPEMAHHEERNLNTLIFFDNQGVT